LELRRRIDQALDAVAMEADVHGVSTRSVDDLVDASARHQGIKKPEVSRRESASPSLVDPGQNTAATGCAPRSETSNGASSSTTNTPTAVATTTASSFASGWSVVEATRLRHGRRARSV
jgi:Transposase, Mutator family